MLKESSIIKQVIKKLVYFILSPLIKKEGPSDSIYITFDDGPHQIHTLEILDILKNHGASATFFFNGNLMEQHPDIVAKVLNEGHQIGYHSYEHKSLKAKSIISVYNDLQLGRRLLSQYGVKEFLYRPPYGDLSISSFSILAFTGWKIIMWSIEGRDSFDTEEEVIDNLDVKNISMGSIILLHDVYEKTPKVLPVILNNLAHSNFKSNKLSYK